MYKLSVVTVCYNAEDTIEKTIQSVLQQTYEEIEYFIIDGISTDRTLEIAEQYAKKYHNIHIISEKDTGIYNAMNKGARLVTGDYLYFLNCGDLFWNHEVVAKVMEAVEQNHNPELIYGNIMVDYHTHQTKIPYGRKKRLNRILIALGITVCHQSLFAKTELLRQRGFDEAYRLWADQEWMMYQLKQKVSVLAIDTNICIYDGYGLSASNESLERVFQESDHITKQYAPFIYYSTKPMKALLRIYRRWQRREKA